MVVGNHTITVNPADMLITSYILVSGRLQCMHALVVFLVVMMVLVIVIVVKPSLCFVYTGDMLIMFTRDDAIYVKLFYHCLCSEL